MDKNKRIKFGFDEKEDIFYLSLKEGEAVDSEEIAENIRVEYNEKRKVVAIEIFNKNDSLLHCEEIK